MNGTQKLTDAIRRSKSTKLADFPDPKLAPKPGELIKPTPGGSGQPQVTYPPNFPKPFEPQFPGERMKEPRGRWSGWHLLKRSEIGFPGDFCTAIDGGELMTVAITGTRDAAGKPTTPGAVTLTAYAVAGPANLRRWVVIGQQSGTGDRVYSFSVPHGCIGVNALVTATTGPVELAYFVSKPPMVE